MAEQSHNGIPRETPTPSERLRRKWTEAISPTSLPFAVVTSPRRVLIDWDFGAHGIWTIHSPEQVSAPLSRGKWAPYEPPRDRPRSWSDLLPGALLDALDGWNHEGETLGRRRATNLELEAFRQCGAELAQRVQQELGSGYEVLHVLVGGAWHWVHPWSQRTPSSLATSPPDNPHAS
jgi:hypothetical protein